MSPGSKLTVILGGVAVVILAIGWVLRKLVGPMPGNREAPPAGRPWEDIHHDGHEP